MPVAEHLVAHTHGGDRSLLQGERASWLWEHFRRNLVGVRSCLLMSNHPHVVAEPGNLIAFRGTLNGFTRRFGVRFDIAAPEPANSEAIATRMAAYGLLNPVRAGITEDPFKWPWSTARDLVGAVVDPWTRPPSRRIFRKKPDLLRAVLGKLDVPCRAPAAQDLAAASVSSLVNATASALRISPRMVRSKARGRRLVAHAARAVGNPDHGALALALDMHPRSIRRFMTSTVPDAPGLEAVLMCLGDPRLQLHGF